MACTLKKEGRCYTSAELFPVAAKLAAILYEQSTVAGVALTGSVARLEEHVHDIDLVVLHTGRGEGSFVMAEYPPLEDIDRPGSWKYATRMEELGRVVPWRSEERIKLELITADGRPGQPYKGVHLNLVCVDQKILTDCAYLWSLEKLAKDEDFFNRVFCDIPLRLLVPASSREQVAEIVGGTPMLATDFGPHGCIGYRDLGHRCTNKRCLPRKPWEVRKRERDRALLVASGNLPE